MDNSLIEEIFWCRLKSNVVIDAVSQQLRNQFK